MPCCVAYIRVAQDSVGLSLLAVPESTCHVDRAGPPCEVAKEEDVSNLCLCPSSLGESYHSGKRKIKGLFLQFALNSRILTH